MVCCIFFLQKTSCTYISNCGSVLTWRTKEKCLAKFARRQTRVDEGFDGIREARLDQAPAYFKCPNHWKAQVFHGMCNLRNICLTMSLTLIGTEICTHIYYHILDVRVQQDILNLFNDANANAASKTVCTIESSIRIIGNLGRSLIKFGKSIQNALRNILTCNQISKGYDQG